MEPLDPELRRIIREGLAEAVPGPAVEGRVLAGLLAKLPPGGGGGDGGGAGGTSAGAVGGAKAWWIAGVVALGVVGATAVTRETEPSQGGGRGKVGVDSGHVSKDRPVVEAAEVSAGAAVVEETPAAARAGVAGRSTREIRGGTPAASGTSEGERRAVALEASTGVAAPADALLAESRGVAEAEAALGRGEFSLAIARVQELARSHPAGQLRLEREAVEICARCGLREVGAGAAAEAFLRAHADAAVAGKVRARCAEALAEKF